MTDDEAAQIVQLLQTFTQSMIDLNRKFDEKFDDFRIDMNRGFNAMNKRFDTIDQQLQIQNDAIKRLRVRFKSNISIPEPAIQPVKSEPVADFSTIENIVLPEEPKIPNVVDPSNKENQPSDMFSANILSDPVIFPVSITADVLISTNPAVAIDVPISGPGPPARYNLRSNRKGKKDVCCINGCR